MRAIRRLTVRTVLPEPLQPLGELVANLRWSWHPPTQDVFALIDPDLWESLGNDPVRLLGEVPTARLETLAADEAFLTQMRSAHADLQAYLTEPRWYQTQHDADESSRPVSVAYFSPEFGISHVLPQYSGGLGILAGDHLKAASDLGVPVVGVGLLYRYGYFVQSLSRDGWQQERYPLVDPDNLSLSPLREPDGRPTRVHVGLPDERSLAAAVWVARVGRVPLLLLDSNVEENAPIERDITDKLYGGSAEHRLLQEMLLGIGGVRALRAYARITGTAEPSVYHSNEGHAGFLGLERIRELTEHEGLTLETALEATRAATVFTTHTPVPAGIDRFPRDLVAQYLGGQNASPGVPADWVLDLGAETYPEGDPGVFNMAVMGLRLAQRANGVSTLHGAVSRDMFAGLWPSFDAAEVPITSITNGVHAPTWVTPRLAALAGRSQGSGTLEEQENWYEGLLAASDAQLWAVKRDLRETMVVDARHRLRRSWLERGASEAELDWTEGALDPDVLTIGFARRVPSYKRLTLMLRDPDRLRRLLLDPERPVQLVIAGKSHPADDGGKRLIAELVRFADDPDVRHRIVFLPNYDMGMALPLYPGCDVWLNNPLRPYEACGTSGMKAALNGALNLSVLDGWWDEWFDGDNGWQIPSAEGVENEDRRDELEAAALYDLIENQVAARFYDVDAEGVPARWMAMLRHTWESLGPKVQATRMVREYVDGLYRPAAVGAATLAAAGYSGAQELATWKARVSAGWKDVAIEHIEAAAAPLYELGGEVPVRVYVALGGLDPADVTVELLYGTVGDEDELREPSVAALRMVEAYDGARYRYDGEVPLAHTGAFGYTVRVVPRHEALISDSELGLAALP
ncbi:MAG TPA: alpha-glucan family phosphorylase [Jiangellaceae bacterium]|nr:alpha-glucan family phosphorylase [Jiangellaceae bacterium]